MIFLILGNARVCPITSGPIEPTNHGLCNNITENDKHQIVPASSEKFVSVSRKPDLTLKQMLIFLFITIKGKYLWDCSLFA